MGSIVISIRGSFAKQRDRTFSAMHGGHAKAVAEAIEFLSQILPESINQDHRLHDDGARPEVGWGKNPRN